MLDNFRKTDIVWERSSNEIDKHVRVSSSDENGRKLVVQVLDGTQVKNLQGVNLNLAWETEGGHYQGLDVFTQKDPSIGLFEIYYTTEMLSHVGDLKANLQLVDSKGTVTSEPFGITVFSGLNKKGVQSSNSFSTLAKALSHVSNIDNLIGLSTNQYDNIMGKVNRLEGRVDDNYAVISGDVGSIQRDQAALRTHVDRKFSELTKDLNEVLQKLTVETGSNSKGSWIKRPDGSMECTMTATIGGKLEEYGNLFFTHTNPAYIEFPQTFQDTPTLSFATDRYNWFWATGYVSRNGITDAIGYRSYDSLFDPVRVTITAHGHWNKGGGILFRTGQEEAVVNHWRSHLDNKISRVKALERSSSSVHSFGFITDMHMEASSYRSFDLMEDVVSELDLGVFVNGGDQANNGVGAKKDRTLRQIRNMRNGFGNIQHKMMNVMGNHDDNSISRLWDETIKHPELKKELFDYMGSASVRGPSGKYHYRDDRLNKTRYIVLDSVDIPYVKSEDGLKYLGIRQFAYRQDQLNWFANVALDTPTGYSVVVFSHTPPYKGSIKGFDNPTRNADLARGILKAYKNKEVYTGKSSNVESEFAASINADFRSKGGDVVAWFCGHVHYDNVQLAPEGFQIITTLNDSAQPWSDAPKRTLGTTTENAFDIVTVDKSERKIYLTRVGAGKDRVASY